MLGPSSLDPRTLRKLIKQKRYRHFVNKCNRGKMNWKDEEFDDLKLQIRLFLRTQQKKRCIYCRRIIPVERRNAYEDIEHFLDKSKPHYRKWSFSCVNLSLSCRACNFEKSTKDMGDATIRASVRHTSTAGEYLWLHPYFDDYHANIEIRKGWIYSIKKDAPQQVRARNLITGCKLYLVEVVESSSQVKIDYMYRLTTLMGKAHAKGRNKLFDRLLERSLKLQKDSFFG